MKHILLIVTAFICKFALAQPDFTKYDMPNIGDQDTIRVIENYLLNHVPEVEVGNNYVWDYSDLPIDSLSYKYAVHTYRPKTHPLSNFFPHASFEDYIISGANEFLNLYDFENDTLLVYRIGSVPDILWDVERDPYPKMIFPYVFNETKSVIVNLNNTITNDQITYDGFGTLMLPHGKTHTNVFRFTNITYSTSSAISTIGYTMNWYKQGGHIPLLSMESTYLPTLYNIHCNTSNSAILGIEDTEEQTIDFRISPNPSTGIFHIQTNGYQPDKVEVFSMLGEKIYNGNSEKQINLSSFAKGMYFVTIYEGANRATQKIIIN
jgi:hypothetical protein